MNNKEFVTPYGLFASIVVTVIGVGIFSYPRNMAEAVGTGGWIVTIIGGFLSYILIHISYKAIKINNFKKFYEIVDDNFGRLIGIVLSLIFVASILASVSLGMRVFVEVIKMYLLEKTPTEFILIITILTGVYLIRGEIDALIKFNEISFWIMFIPIIIVLILTLNKTDLTNIFPILANKPVEYLKSLKGTVYSFGGLEIIYMLTPFMKDRKKVPRAALKAVGFITAFYIVIVLFTLAIFSKEQSKVLLWPTITMIQSIYIPGAFIERWEGVVMALWVVFYFTTFSNSYYLCTDIVKDMFRLQDIKVASVLVAPFVYAIAMYPENIAEIYNANDNIMPLFSLFILVILPLMLILVTPLRKGIKRGGSRK
ncbi:endospore germination permease [Clostridium sp. DJ247]|uniref:GerAB/ArcD/ProY family transporter n=1 Tax=Clostridium sp. DJ247 TaxID=2726188 RepID=UPI001F4D3216|nr:endospore germination permease [Clostridium sp. DJ247]